MSAFTRLTRRIDTADAVVKSLAASDSLPNCPDEISPIMERLSAALDSLKADADEVKSFKARADRADSAYGPKMRIKVLDLSQRYDVLLGEARSMFDKATAALSAAQSRKEAKMKAECAREEVEKARIAAADLASKAAAWEMRQAQRRGAAKLLKQAISKLTGKHSPLCRQNKARNTQGVDDEEVVLLAARLARLGGTADDSTCSGTACSVMPQVNFEKADTNDDPQTFPSTLTSSSSLLIIIWAHPACPQSSQALVMARIAMAVPDAESVCVDTSGLLDSEADSPTGTVKGDDPWDVLLEDLNMPTEPLAIPKFEVPVTETKEANSGVPNGCAMIAITLIAVTASEDGNLTVSPTVMVPGDTISDTTGIANVAAEVASTLAASFDLDLALLVAQTGAHVGRASVVPVPRPDGGVAESKTTTAARASASRTARATGSPCRPASASAGETGQRNAVSVAHRTSPGLPALISAVQTMKKHCNQRSEDPVALRSRSKDKIKSASFITALKTLRRFADNVIGHPREAKYRSVRVGNKGFQRNLGSIPGGIEAMLALGFKSERRAPKNSSTLKEEDFLVLPSTTEANELLSRLRPVLQHAIEAATSKSSTGSLPTRYSSQNTTPSSTERTASVLPAGSLSSVLNNLGLPNGLATGTGRSAGGMGGFADLMNNPALLEMAASLRTNPAVQNLMSSMQQSGQRSMGLGAGSPNQLTSVLSGLPNIFNNPELVQMAQGLMQDPSMESLVGQIRDQMRSAAGDPRHPTESGEGFGHAAASSPRTSSTGFGNSDFSTTTHTSTMNSSAGDSEAARIAQAIQMSMHGNRGGEDSQPESEDEEVD
jgi:hypothetical protein